MLRELYFMIENILDIPFCHAYIFNQQEAKVINLASAAGYNRFNVGTIVSYSMPTRRSGSGLKKYAMK